LIEKKFSRVFAPGTGFLKPVESETMQTMIEVTPLAQDHIYLDAHQSANLIRLKVESFRQLVRAGKLPAGIQISARKTIWSKADLIAFVEASR